MKIAILGIYALVLVAISLYTMKKTKTLDDYFLGGRKMGAWISAFAYGTSYFSAVIFIGYAGKLGWSFGLSVVWIGIGNAIIGSLLAWLVLGRRTRKLTHKLDVSTMPEFFESRYGSKAMKILAAILIFIFLVPYSASVYQGLSYLFEEVFGIPFIYCVIGMAVLTAGYLVAGGYMATALSDFIQGIIMLAGVGLVIFFVIKNPNVGGLAAGFEKLSAIDPKLTAAVGPPGWWPLLSLVILTSLGSWALPQMVHKFYAIKDEKAIIRGTVISTAFALIIAGGAYFIGVFGRLFLVDGVPVDPTTGAANFDMIMPQMLDTALAHSSVLIGIIVVLVLSASMSTLSSLVLVSSSAISIDLIGAVNPKVTKEKTQVTMRWLCLVFVVLSVVLALGKFTTIITLMSLSWGTISGAFLGPFLFGLYMKRTTKIGAWAGLIVGLGTALVLNLFFPAITSPMAGTFAMAASLVFTPLVSFMTKPMPEEMVKKVTL